jgi:hypothetical protein
MTDHAIAVIRLHFALNLQFERQFLQYFQTYFPLCAFPYPVAHKISYFSSKACKFCLNALDDYIFSALPHLLSGLQDDRDIEKHYTSDNGRTYLFSHLLTLIHFKSDSCLTVRLDDTMLSNGIII